MTPCSTREDRQVARTRLIVACTVLASIAIHLVFVAGAASDVPYYDEWGAEGAFLYPKSVDGSLRAADMFAPHNEHRIAFTRAINLLLFRANGMWDPLVVVLVGALLRGLATGAIARVLLEGRTPGHQGLLAAAALLFFSPLASWENALTGFQSQVAFSLVLVGVAFQRISSGASRSWRRRSGYVAAAMGQFAMSPGMLAAPALLAWLCLRAWMRRKDSMEDWAIVALMLGSSALLWTPVPAHAALHASSFQELLVALGRITAWPHVGAAFAPIVICFPTLALLMIAVRRWQLPDGADGLILLGSWALGIAGALAWSRGGQSELGVVIPSRYSDFLAVLVLTGLACACALVGRRPVWLRVRTSWLLAAWTLFILVGYAGVSAESMRWIIHPRWTDRWQVAERLRVFQSTGDASVFAGVPRVHMPAMDLQQLSDVLHDPRLKGRLPPSLQEGVPPGPLSRLTHSILGNAGTVMVGLLAAGVSLTWRVFRTGARTVPELADPDASRLPPQTPP